MNHITISLFFVVEMHESGCPCCDGTRDVRSGPFVTLEQAKKSASEITISENATLTVVEYELDPTKLCKRY